MLDKLIKSFLFGIGKLNGSTLGGLAFPAAGKII
jgi:hypothetical protein